MFPEAIRIMKQGEQAKSAAGAALQCELAAEVLRSFGTLRFPATGWSMFPAIRPSVAYGTPFTGELAKLGENEQAPLAALYLLAQGPENRIDPVSSADAGRELLGNMLFFADDPEMVRLAFQAACDFVDRVPVFRLTFLPDARVWNLIG